MAERSLGGVVPASDPAIAGAQIAGSHIGQSEIGESHRTLLATPTALEVGVPSGTQGWLRIRAEVSGSGEVNASLSTASSAATETLHTQLPALNAFLHSEQIAATTTVLNREDDRAIYPQLDRTTIASGNSSGGEGLSGSGGSPFQGGSHNNDRQASDRLPSNGKPLTLNASASDSPGLSLGAGVSATDGIGNNKESGRWLNVRV